MNNFTSHVSFLASLEKNTTLLRRSILCWKLELKESYKHSSIHPTGIGNTSHQKEAESYGVLLLIGFIQINIDLFVITDFTKEYYQ